jgi:hypothetical protein
MMARMTNEMKKDVHKHLYEINENTNKQQNEFEEKRKKQLK